MSSSLVTMAYIAATILFILSLGGLSNPETSRRGNLYGIVGMTIAVLATVFGPRVTAAGFPWIIGSLAVGGTIGLYAARKVQMTQMPELVAIMHSLVGLAACIVGFASYVDTSIAFTGSEKTIHEVEIYLGILIGNSVLTEVVFNRPGLGKLIVGALNQRDYTMLQGMMVIYTFVVVIVNLATDLTYGLIDPRVKYK